MSKDKLLNIRMKLANPKIDDILEDYYKGKHDLISVRKDVLLLCDKLMELAYNQALEDVSDNLESRTNPYGVIHEHINSLRESILKLKI